MSYHPSSLLAPSTTDLVSGPQPTAYLGGGLQLALSSSGSSTHAFPFRWLAGIKFFAVPWHVLQSIIYKYGWCMCMYVLHEVR
jgi:hypothetical protein